MIRKQREIASVDQLNQMQRYLGEEAIEEYQEGLLTRRQMFRQLLRICGSGAAAAALLAACGVDTTTPALTSEATRPPTNPPSPSPSATAAAPEPTQPTPPVGAAPLSVPADDPDITGTEVTFQSDTEVVGYLARPQAEGVYPGVIVIHENRGLNDHIRDVARRVAKAGYVALAPDLASRAGGTPQLGPDQVRGYFGNANPDELVRDLNAAVDFLGQQPGVQAGTHGVVGFCFGGAYTLRLAAANPNIAAAVCYYGVTPEPASQMSATNAAILGQYGGNDERVNSTIPALEQVMQESGKTFEKRIYEGSNHAFNNDTGQNYNEAAAVAAWNETLAWFDTYLKE
ncbi:MAG: dienelactone hydrolase family protein [Chloroflexales bacterium]|nr:dienelactone hydrolase family protein [Chloroflexales bacterium]